MSGQFGERCPHCKQLTMRDDATAGEYVCMSCGRVSPHPFIDETSEYRQFALEHGVKNKLRAEHSGDTEEYGTGVAYDGSSKAKRLALAIRRQNTDPKMARIKKHSKTIRSMARRLNEMNPFSGVGLEREIADHAIELFREASDAGLLDNKKGEVVDAACLDWACAAKGEDRGIDMFRQLLEVSKRVYNAAREKIHELPSLQEMEQKWEGQIRGYHLPENVEKAALEVCAFVRENGVCPSKQKKTVVNAVVVYTYDMWRSPNKPPIEELFGPGAPQKETIMRAIADIKKIESVFKNVKKFPAVMELCNSGK